jgi:hypothetical protein
MKIQTHKLALITIALVAWAAFHAGTAAGQTNTWDGSSSIYWNTASNWSLNHVPLGTEDVVIPNSVSTTYDNPTINVNAVCKSLTMTGGNQAITLTLSGTYSLSVSESVTINAGTSSGYNKIIAVGTGSLSCGSITMQTTGGDDRYSRVSASTGTITVSGDITMNGTAARNNIYFTGAGKLYVGGTMSGGGLTASTSEVIYNGVGNETVEGYTFYDLTINKGTSSATVTSQTSAIAVTNNLTVTQGNLVLSATNADYSFHNVTVPTNGTITHTVSWDGTSHLVSISGNLDVTGIFNPTVRSHVNMNTAGTKTIRTGDNPASTLSILTFNDGTFSANGTVKTNQEAWVMFGVAGTFSTAGYNVTFSSMNNYTGTVNVNGGSLTVNSTCEVGYASSVGAINVSSGTFTVNGNLQIDANGSLTCTNSPSINVSGNWTNNGAFTRAAETVTLNGSGTQTIAGTASTAFNNLTLSNSAGALLGNSISVGGTLTLTSGILKLGSYNLTLNTNTAIAGAPFGTSKMIQADGTGYIAKSINSTGSYDFPVGSNTNSLAYSPATINFTSGTFFTAYLNLHLQDVKEPNVTQSNWLKRYWILGFSGTFTNPVYTAVFTYADADVNIPASESNLAAAKWTGSWTKYANSVNTASNTLTFTGLTSFSDFSAIGDLTVTMGHTDATCYLKPDGTGTATPSGGTGPYSWSWNSAPGQTTQSAAGLRAGTYSAVVTDNLGSSISGSVTILEPPAVTVSVLAQNPGCNGAGDGWIRLTGSGGTSPYQYSINNGGTWTTGSNPNPYTFTGQPAGTSYKTRVKDSNGCMSPKMQ